MNELEVLQDTLQRVWDALALGIRGLEEFALSAPPEVKKEIQNSITYILKGSVISTYELINPFIARVEARRTKFEASNAYRMLYVLRNSAAHSGIHNQIILDKPGAWWRLNGDSVAYLGVEIKRIFSKKGKKFHGTVPTEFPDNVWTSSFVGQLIQDCRTLLI